LTIQMSFEKSKPVALYERLFQSISKKLIR
jgi:hypothetical protein